MPNPYFQFKQFTVWHNQSAMKVGTDGVLLGAWTCVSSSKQILDIGTGTGLVALMLAQRCNAQITALEIDKSAARQAVSNVNLSPWKDRISVINQDFILYNPNKRFDTIVSNPPYFVDSLQCPNQQRNQARHTADLTYDTLLEGVSRLLSCDGTFTIIMPYDVNDLIQSIAQKHRLFPFKRMNVFTTPSSSPKRCLLAFSQKKQECQEEELLIETARHQYSDKYIKLTKEFYLKM